MDIPSPSEKRFLRKRSPLAGTIGSSASNWQLALRHVARISHLLCRSCDLAVAVLHCAHAVTFTVTTTADADAGSLRQATRAARRVVIAGLTLRNGRASGTSLGDAGSAILVAGWNLTRRDCLLTANTAPFGGAFSAYTCCGSPAVVRLVRRLFDFTACIPDSNNTAARTHPRRGVADVHFFRSGLSPVGLSAGILEVLRAAAKWR